MNRDSPARVRLSPCSNPPRVFVLMRTSPFIQAMPPLSVYTDSPGSSQMSTDGRMLSAMV